MKKRIISLFLVISLIFTLFPNIVASARAETIASGTSEEGFHWVLDSEGTLTISGEGPMEDHSPAGAGYGSWVNANVGFPDVKIQKVIISEGITKIGNSAFASCLDLKSVKIADTVTEIGGWAFLTCEKLHEIEIPSSVELIGNMAFQACEKLEQIVLPEGIPSIGDQTFAYCSSLQSIVIPSSVTSIGTWAFANCDQLRQIYFSGNAPSFGDGTYDYVFDSVIATAYYPADNSTWTADIMQDHGGFITWEPMDSLGNTNPTVESPSLFIPVVESRIVECKFDSLSTEKQQECRGILVDLDSDGNDELILRYLDRWDDLIFEVWKIQNGTPSCINTVNLFSGGIGTNGSISSAAYEGKQYLVYQWINSGMDYVNDMSEVYCLVEGKYEYMRSVSVSDLGKLTTLMRSNYDIDKDEAPEGIIFSELADYIDNASKIEETSELKVYTTFPYATLGVDQTAKLLITLLVNGKPTPIQEFALGNNNSEVIDLVDTKDADGVRVLTFKTLSPGVANLTFTEGITGATVSIEMAVEEMCSYYRCSNFPIPDASSFPIHVADFQCTENTDGTHNVKFNAYNTSYAYGAAIVYDDTGAFWSCVPLNPKYDGTGMEYIANGFWQSWEQTWYWIDGDKEFYEVAGNAMLTEVEFNNIPQNAKIVITADGRESVYPVLYTGIDIFLKVAFYSANIDLNINVYQKSVKEFVVALLKALPADAAQNTIQTLTTDISMALIDGVNSESVEKIYQAVWNMFENLGLNADEMLKNVLSGLGYSVADTVVIAAVPAYSFVDLVNKIVAVAWLFVDYDSNLDRGKMEIHCVEHASNNQLVNSSVVVIQQSEFSKDTILDAYVVTDAEELETLPDSVTSDIENYSVYNITLRESGAEVQPGEEIEIRVPIPENVNPDKCVIYRLEDDGVLTLLPSTTEDGYIVFTTTHLSYYIVGEGTDEMAYQVRVHPAIQWIVVGSACAIIGILILAVWHRGKRKAK